MKKLIATLKFKKKKKHEINYYIGGENRTAGLSDQSKITNVEIYMIFNAMLKQVKYLLRGILSEADTEECEEIQAKLYTLRAIQEKNIEEDDLPSIFEPYYTLLCVLKEIYIENDNSKLNPAEQLEALSLIHIVYKGYEKIVQVTQKKQEIDRLVILKRIQSERAVWTNVNDYMQEAESEQEGKIQLLNEIQKQMYATAYTKTEQATKEDSQFEKQLRQAFEKEIEAISLLLETDTQNELHTVEKVTQRTELIRRLRGEETKSQMFGTLKSKVAQRVRVLLEGSLNALQDVTLQKEYENPQEHIERITGLLERLDTVQVKRKLEMVWTIELDQILTQIYQEFLDNILTPLATIQLYDVDTENQLTKQRYNEFTTPLLYAELEKYFMMEQVYQQYAEKREEFLEKERQYTLAKGRLQKQQEIAQQTERNRYQQQTQLERFNQQIDQTLHYTKEKQTKANLEVYAQKLQEIQQSSGRAKVFGNGSKYLKLEKKTKIEKGER